MLNIPRTSLKYTLIFAWIISPAYLHAENNQFKRDTTFVTLLLDSAYRLETIDSDKALEVYSQAYYISRQLNYTLGTAKATHYTGIVYSDKSNYAKAVQKYKEALQLYRKINYSRGIGACYTNLGNIYHYQSKLDSALRSYQFALDVFQQHSHLDALAQANGNIGVIFQKMGQFKKSLDYQMKSKKLAIQLKDSLVLCRALVNIGAIYDEIKDPEKSLKNQKHALQIAEKINDEYTIQITNINIADYYKEKEDYPKALQYAHRSLQTALKLGTPYDIADIKKAIGGLYLLKGDRRTAKLYFEEAIKLSEQIKAKEISSDVYYSLQKLYAGMGDYKQAYKYQSLAVAYQDSMYGEKQVKAINELEVRYQAAQKEKALAQQRLQIAQKEIQLEKSERYIIYSVGAAALALLAALLVIYIYRNKRRLHEQQLQSLKQEKEIQVLQALMTGEEKERTRIARDLHDDVAGMLAAAKMQMNALALQAKEIINYRGYGQVISLLDDASGSVRKTAHNLMPELLMQYGLDKALQRYCNNLSNDLLQVQYDSWGEIERYDDSFELAVYRIAQEVLNNVIKHSEATQVLVQMSCNEGLLSLTIEDNGVGFDKSVETNGLGLHGLRSRVEALKGVFEIDSQIGEGTNIYLEFNTRPIMTEEPY